MNGGAPSSHVLVDPLSAFDERRFTRSGIGCLRKDCTDRAARGNRVTGVRHVADVGIRKPGVGVAGYAGTACKHDGFADRSVGYTWRIRKLTAYARRSMGREHHDTR